MNHLLLFGLVACLGVLTASADEENAFYVDNAPVEEPEQIALPITAFLNNRNKWMRTSMSAIDTYRPMANYVPRVVEVNVPTDTETNSIQAPIRFINGRPFRITEIVSAVKPQQQNATQATEAPPVSSTTAPLTFEQAGLLRSGGRRPYLVKIRGM